MNEPDAVSLTNRDGQQDAVGVASERDGEYMRLRCSHPHCIACRDLASGVFSLGLSFSADENRCVYARYRVSESVQGYKGLLHGGIMSTLLDAAMTHCLFFHGIKALTAELQVRFLAPVPVGSELTITARLNRARRGVYWLSAEVADPQQRYATAEATFMTNATVAAAAL